MKDLGFGVKISIEETTDGKVILLRNDMRNTQELIR